MRRRPMSAGWLFPLALACAPLPPAGEAAPGETEPPNPIVQVLEEELEREVALLQGPGELVRAPDYRDPGSVISPCSRGSAGYEEASQELLALDDAIAAAHLGDE